MATVTIEHETESPAGGGWEFTVAIADGNTLRARHTVRLSWADYEYWSHGAAAPERVARAVVEALLAAGEPKPLPDRFDAATGRRWLRTLDERVRAAL